VLYGDFPRRLRYSAYPVDCITPVLLGALSKLSGLTLEAIAQRLDKEGIPTPMQVLEKRGQLPKNRVPGLQWDKSTVKVILTHSAYVDKLRGWYGVNP
jgi:Recombinase